MSSRFKDPAPSPSNTEIQAASDKVRRCSILLIYICTFFYWMALYLYVPILPVYAESIGASLTVVGIIVAAYAIPMLLFRIPLGIWADALGRQKPLIICGSAILAAGSVGLGISPNPLFLGISRALVGIGAAMWVVFPVYLVTFYSNEKIGQAMGMLNFVTGAALVAATLAGGIIADFQGAKISFFSAAVIAVIALIVLLFAKEYRGSRQKTMSWQSFRQVARRPLLIVVSIMGVLVFFAEFAGVWGFIPVYAARIGASSTILGILAMLVTVGSMIGALAVAPIMKRWGYFPPIVLSSLMLGVVLVAVPFIQSLAVLGVGLLIHGTGYGILSTQLMVLSIYKIGPSQRATAMGLFQGIYAIGMLAGPLAAGFISESYGLPVVFYVGGFVCLAIIGLAFLPVIPGRNETATEKNRNIT